MFGLSRARQKSTDLFAGRFEADGDYFLYRNRPTAAPIRVSADERERFIADYSKAFGRILWGTAFLLIAMSVVTTFFLPSRCGAGPPGSPSRRPSSLFTP
jgi:hypothetical protein